MGKSKELSQALRKIIVDLHKSGSCLGAIYKCLKVPCSSVQTIVRKNKHHWTTQPSYRSGRRRVMSPRDERTLVRKGPNQSQNNSKSISTLKQVLYRHNLKGRSARKKPLLQNHHKNARLRFATAHGDKDRTFWENGLMKQKYNCLAIMTIFMIGGKRGRLASRRTPSQL